MTRTQDQGKDSTMADDGASGEKMTEYPERRTVAWIDDVTGEIIGQSEYIHHAEVTRMQAARLREAIIMGMRIATLTPIEEVPDAIEAALAALEGKP
jgi:hypothetical protein